MDREVEAVDSGESAGSGQNPLSPAPVLLHLWFCFHLRVPVGPAVGLPSEGDAVRESGQTGTPDEQVLLG